MRFHQLRNLIFSALGGVGFGWLLLTYLSVGEAGLANIQGATLWFLTAGGIASLVNYLVTSQLNGLVRWKQNTSLRLLLGVMATLLILIGAFILLLPLVISLDQSTLYKVGILAFVSAIIFNVIYFAVYSFYQFSQTQIQYVENQRQQLQLQLDALRSQLSPHFLFNCLNTISALLYRNQGSAERFIRQLAKTYQYTINTKEQSTIPLSKELEFVKAYQFLLAVRFEDQVEVKIDLSDTLLKSKVPPMTIQLLIENAVKHNTISKEQKLEIEVVRRDAWLVVKNNKTKKPARTPSFKIGLENIKKRYNLLHQKSIKVIDEQDEFQIHLPIVAA